jgi:hypothetical protein
MTMSAVIKRPIGAVMFLVVVAAATPALAQADAARPFVGGAIFGESVDYRSSLGFGGGAAVGWAMTAPWTAQIELEVPTTVTRVTTYQTPVCYYQPCWVMESRTEETRQEPTVSILFGRSLPPVGRFRAVLLFGPGARFDRSSTKHEATPNPSAPYQNSYENYSYERSNMYPAFVMGFDAVITLSGHVAVVPQLRVNVSPALYDEVRPAIIRPGISVRWTF